MKRIIFLCLLGQVLAGSFGFGQAARIEVDTRTPPQPWTNLEVADPAQNFHFAIITDRTGGARPGVFQEAIHKLNLLQPAFVISIGDLIEGYTNDKQEIERQWDEVDGFLDSLDMPFFYLPGNHDYSNLTMAKAWKARLGRDYYHFRYQDVLFLGINSEEGMGGSGQGYLSNQQFRYFRRVLRENEGVRWTLVFMHQPLWNQGNSGRWDDLEALLANRPHTVFAGHYHRYTRYERHDQTYVVLATTGGASSLRGPKFGEFDHVMWVSMTSEGPVLANLLLEGIFDEHIRTEAQSRVYRNLMYDGPATLAPLLVEAESFSQDSVALRLTNDSNFPLEIAFGVTASPSLWLPVALPTLTLPPNSQQDLRLPLHSNGHQPLAGLEPVALELRYTYFPPEMPPLTQTQRLALRPEALLPLPLATHIPQVDGVLGEWDLDLPGHPLLVETDPFSYRGQKDLTFRFGLKRDKTFLYGAVLIEDDDVYGGTGQRGEQADGLFVLLDPCPPKTTSREQLRRSRAATRLFTIRPGEAGGKPVVSLPGNWPSNGKVAVSQDEKGYTVEWAYPLEVLQACDEAGEGKFRINLWVRDADQQGRHLSTHYWFPDWRGEVYRAGSGTFFWREE